jgi:hypothetical protein
VQCLSLVLKNSLRRRLEQNERTIGFADVLLNEFVHCPDGFATSKTAFEDETVGEFHSYSASREAVLASGLLKLHLGFVPEIFTFFVLRNQTNGRAYVIFLFFWRLHVNIST